jgi:transcriptional regulator with XRE-family HTH domain
MDLPQILGRNVREVRKLRGMSQEELALEANMKRSYVSDMERGTRNPSVKAIGRLAIALGVEPSVLLSVPESVTWTTKLAR